MSSNDINRVGEALGRPFADGSSADHLSADALNKSYSGSQALSDVSFQTNDGEFLTILGPSGSGKTTLLKVIAGFETVDSGRLDLQGRDILSQPPHVRNIGMLFQNYALFPHMTVRKNIEYPLKMRKVPKAERLRRVLEAAQLVQMEQFLDRYPQQLSGGQQQRVALARAIIFNPPILLLDEPLSALDRNLRSTMQNEIRSLQKATGITTIMVTHDQEEALTMSDRVCVMRQGTIEQISSPEELYRRPASRFVAEFVGEINMFDVTRDADKGEHKFRAICDSLVKFNIPSASSDDAEIRAAGIRPEDLHVVKSSDVFDWTVKASLVDAIFVGNFVRAKLTTENGSQFSTYLHSSMASGLSNGDEMEIGWNDSAVIAIRD